MSDSLANKGILYAKIKIGKSYLKIFNTHLQASYFGSSESHWNISVKTRLDHIEELCYFLKEILHDQSLQESLSNSDESHNGNPAEELEDTKILLVGDFNVDAHNYEKKRKVIYFCEYNK